MPRLVLSLLALPLLSSVGWAINDRENYNPGNEPPQLSSWPKPWDQYHLLPSSVSPDLRYGFICPGSSEIDPAKLELVELKPFTVLREMMADKACFHGQKSYGVNWAQDSSSVLFFFCAKWGVDQVLLVSLAKGKAGKVIDLADEVRKQVQPSYAAAKASRFNDDIDFIFDDEDPSVDETTDWKINEKNQVEIVCICTTDPKHGSASLWEAVFKGIWDIPQGKFIQHQLTVIPKDRLPSF